MAPPAWGCSARNSCFLAEKPCPASRNSFFAYKEVLEQMGNLPVTIRTLDIGADKMPKWSDHSTFANPALGLTGIRLCLAEPNLFRCQLRALLRASHYGNLHILIPMISSIHELQQARMHIELAKQSLTDEGIPFNRNVKLGVMMTFEEFGKRPETPSTPPTLH